MTVHKSNISKKYNFAVERFLLNVTILSYNVMGLKKTSLKPCKIFVDIMLISTESKNITDFLLFWT